MAQWFRFNLVFIEKPSEAALEALNKELYQEDYDAPAITLNGCETTWRSPTVTEEWLQRLFEKHGIACKFQLWESWDWDGEERPWLHEWTYPSKLVELKEKIQALSEAERKALLEWLDQEG